MGEVLRLSEIALDSLHRQKQEQIMGVASYVSPSSPPPFAAQFAEVTVDQETGQVTVDKLVMAVDSGIIVNPLTASGQIEGGMIQALGYAVCEEMRYDSEGNAREKDFINYHIFRADEVPALETIFVETFEPSHPFGVKAVAEIPMDGVAPAVGNAILDAVGVNIDVNPATPERVWRALKKLSAGIERVGMADKIYVIGHINPDTDSIASAMGYAWLLKAARWTRYGCITSRGG